MAGKVLIVDDSATMRQMVSFTLRNAAYEVIEAEHGEEALTRMAEHTFDLIVTDLNMPVMDGIELIRTVRSQSAQRFVPILMLTTESQPEKKLAGKTAGATGWIVKPFDPPKFLSVVSRVLAL